MEKENNSIENKTTDGMEDASFALPSRLGTYYDDTVPDTLDLAEHGRLGLNHFTNSIKEDLDYEMPFIGDFRRACDVDRIISQPAFVVHMVSIGACQVKALECMAFLRVMSGDTQHLEREAKMIEMMVSLLGQDGLYWVDGDANKKPWLFASGHPPEPSAQTHGNGRMIRAMIAWRQYTGDPEWGKRIDRLVDGIDRLMVVHKDGYAYFPVCGFYEEEYFRSSYLHRGWKDISEPSSEKGGEEGSLFNHQGNVAGALANWYRLTGNKQALRLAGELVRFITKPKFWADWKDGEYPLVIGADHAHWNGHFHGHINTLRAILEYAAAANDTRLKAFVRDGYEWARQPSISRIGYVGDGQGCGCGRLIGLAVKMTYEGIGDYWEDVDQYIRNHGTEYQIVPEDIPYLQELVKFDPRSTVGHHFITKVNTGFDDLLKASIGAFPENPFKDRWALCCSTHGNMGLFYAWDGTLRYFDGIAQVNLLLNRASPWMDVYSCLPYEGKAVLCNKAAREAFVRIPLWVDKNAVDCRIGDRSVNPVWLGNYVRFEHLEPDDVITIEFPIIEKTEKWTIPEHPYWPKWEGCDSYTCKFRGNTLIEISPGFLPGSPLYKTRPLKYKNSKIEMKQVRRFVTPFVFKW